MNIINRSVLIIVFTGLLSCNQDKKESNEQKNSSSPGANVQQEEHTDAGTKTLTFACAISNGMKGDSLFFDVSPDGKTLSNLTFKGYWRCSGTLTQERAAGPKSSFTIVNNKVDGVISEPPGGGSTSRRFELHATLSANKAGGTFRMNINNLGCDSYVLKFEGAAR